MHRCLQVPDIVLTIMHFIKAIPMNGERAFVEIHLPYYHGYRHLVSFLLTCKAFLEPGLDIVWRTLRTIAPVVELLPVDAWVKEEWHTDDGPFSRVHIIRALVPSDFDRFFYYSTRVQRIGMMEIEHEQYVFEQIHEVGNEIHRQEVAPDAYAALLQYRPTMHLFPNLRELRWRFPARDTVRYSPLFYGPSLTLFQLALEIMLVASDISAEHLEIIITAIHSLSKMCPNLLDFEMNAVDVGDLTEMGKKLEAALSDVVDSHPLLRTYMLHVQPFTSATDILRFSQKPFLRSCSLAIVDQEMISLLSNPMEVAPFRSLDTLHITLEDMSCFTRFLQVISPCRLDAIELHVHQTPTALDIREGLKALSAHCSHQSLRIMRMPQYWDDDAIPFGEEWSITSDVIEPLFSFPNLIVVYLACFPMLLGLDNHDISRIAARWPKLKTLVLPPAGPRPPAITFQGLFSLSQGCPELAALELALDLSRNDLDEEAMSKLVPNEILHEMDLRNSILGDSTMITDCLHDLFPELDYVTREGNHIKNELIMDEGVWRDPHMYLSNFNRLLRSRWLERDPVLKARLEEVYMEDSDTRDEMNPWA